MTIFDLEDEAFIVHIASIVSKILNPVHFFHRIKIVLVKADEVFIAILS